MNTNILVNIIGEFKKKGFDDADKASKSLGKSFDRLGAKLLGALSVTAILKFSKEAIKAFAEDEKAANTLAQSYKNLGLAFQGAGVNDYIDQVQRASGVSDEKLRPAMQTLTRATLDYKKSQDLLATALDISAGSGKDLESVSTAMARAFNGDLTALTRLNIGITRAQAKTMSFEEAMKILNRNFSGQAKLAANTYEGQMNRLKISVDEAKESIGRDLVTALNKASNSQSLATLGTEFERIAKNIGAMAIGMADVVGQLNRKVDATGAGGWITKFNDFMDKFNIFAQQRDRVLSGEISGVKRRTIGAPGAEQEAKRQATILKEERKRLAQLKALTKEKEKQAKLTAAEKKAAGILAEAQKTFDMERIQIEAALKGKINDVEEYRLRLQKAIINENTDAIIKYTGLLKEAEAQAAELASLLASLPELAENPFTDWPSIIQRIQELLKELDWQIPIDVLFAEKGLKLDQNAMTVTKLDTMSVNATNVYINGGIMGGAGGGPSVDPFKRKTPWGEYDSRDPNASLKMAEKALADALALEAEAAQAAMDAAAAFKDSQRRNDEIDTILAKLALGPNNYGPGDFRMRDNAVNITVNGALDPYAVARQINDIMNLEATTSGTFVNFGGSKVFK